MSNVEVDLGKVEIELSNYLSRVLWLYGELDLALAAKEPDLENAAAIVVAISNVIPP